MCILTAIIVTTKAAVCLLTAFSDGIVIAVAVMHREQACAIGRQVVGEIRLLPRLVGLLNRDVAKLRKVIHCWGSKIYCSNTVLDFVLRRLKSHVVTIVVP